MFRTHWWKSSRAGRRYNKANRLTTSRPLFTENPRRVILGNPHSSTRIPYGTRAYGCGRLFTESPRRVLLGNSEGIRRAGASNSPGIIPPAYLDLCATTSPAVICGGVAVTEDRFFATKSPALQFDCSSASLCSKTLVETTTPSPASTQ